MESEIIKIKIKTEKAGDVIIEKRDNYYVMEWKDGHYELDDCLNECKDIIKAIEGFKEKYNI